MSPIFMALLSLAALVHGVMSFNANANDNMVVYWGQNSYGAANPSNTANFQKNLSAYCQDDSIDVLPIAFLDVFFDTGGLPTINLANICNDVDDPLFSGSDLPECQFMASDIQTCQAAGKIVTLSLGGATGGNAFTSDAQASTFGTQIWNLFLGGSSNTRPFGDAVLDGIDLDIEGGGTQYFDSFVAEIRSLAAGASKPYYISAAPQCPYPDAYMSTVLNAAEFDMVYVQFYNNYCSVASYSDPNDWDYSSWDNWAKTVSLNPDVKIFIGAAASSSAASSGYVDASTLSTIAQQTQSQYSSFGGIMLWDASQAVANGNFQATVKNALTQGGSSSVPPPPPPSTSSTSKTTSTSISTSTSKTTSTSSSSTASAGSCGGVAAWSSSIAYTGGEQVTYNGQLWTAKWWTEADVPGGAAGVWVDDGPCANAALATEHAASPSNSNLLVSAAATPIASHAKIESLIASASAAAHPIAHAQPIATGSRFFRS